MRRYYILESILEVVKAKMRTHRYDKTKQKLLTPNFKHCIRNLYVRAGEIAWR